MTKPISDARVLDELFSTIASRKGGDPEQSYTARLFASGRPNIARKVGEEAVEVVVAALAQERTHVIAESADLFYHLFALWADSGIDASEVWTELERRRGISGIAEKASRKG